MKTKSNLSPYRYRNRFACDPIMRKGGPHQKTWKSKRTKEKQSLRREYSVFNVNVRRLREGICDCRLSNKSDIAQERRAPVSRAGGCEFEFSYRYQLSCPKTCLSG